MSEALPHQLTIDHIDQNICNTRPCPLFYTIKSSNVLPAGPVLALLDHLPADRLHDEEEDVLAAAVGQPHQLSLLDQLAQNIIPRSLLTAHQRPEMKIMMVSVKDAGNSCVISADVSLSGRGAIHATFDSTGRPSP